MIFYIDVKNLFKTYTTFAALIIGSIMCSCTHEDEPQTIECQNTIFMYLPWSSNLTTYFYQNIQDMENSICQMKGLGNDRLIVFISTSANQASMYEIEYQNGTCRHIPISTYNNYPFTTEQGLTSLFIDLKTYAPAKNYSMIIGCHGMGWLPVSTSRAIRSDDKQHWDYPNVPLTRYFGGTTQEFQTDISTLASALSNADLKMQYILFDDCYMSSIEVAYELKDVTNYLIASTCEVMAYGMPYAKMGQYLLGAPDYKAVCDEFYKFYSTYSAAPYGTLSVTDCSKLDALAELMRQINLNYRFDATQITLLQRLDGYSPTIFFDYGDYVNKLLTYNNADQEFIDTFNQKLSSVVPLKTNTEKFFTASKGPLPIYTYSGITTSDPSISPKTIEKTETKWYNATH